MKKILSLILLLSIFFCPAIANAIEGLEVHFIDVGQADAAVILCDNDVMMIDGGNKGDSDLVYSYLTQTLGVKHIDHMIATHPHEDHVGGLSGALNACTVDTIYSPVKEYESKAFKSLIKYAAAQGKSLIVPSVGDTFDLGSAQVTFIAPVRNYENTNDQSIVVRIDYGSTSFIFTGDAEWDSEHDMVESRADLKADVLKVCHHGSDSSSSYVFLRKVMPRYAVISCGKGNSYGHPHEKVLSRLRDAGSQVYRTDLQGTIICRSDGKNLTFETERQITQNELFLSGDQTQNKVNGQKAKIDAISQSKSNKTLYIGNKNTKKFHQSSCSSVDQMKDENKVEFHDRDKAVEKGYVPCKRCKP